MPKVSEFTKLAALTSTSRIPVAQRSDQDDPEDLHVTPVEIEAYLIGRGFNNPESDITGIDVRDALQELIGDNRLSASAIRGLPTSSNGTPGASAYDIWLSNGGSGTEEDFLNSLSAETQRAILSDAIGITVDIEFSGVVPTIAGSGGNYTLTIVTGCVWRNFHVDVPNTAAGTDAGEFSLTIVNTSGVRDWSAAELTEYGDGEVLDDSEGLSGIKRTQIPAGTDRIENTWVNLNGLNGFGIFFNR